MEKWLRRFYFTFCSLMLFLAFERAAHMYITVDEAITYTDHIRPRISGLYDFSAANNHLLNTVLVKILSIFAPYNELVMRLPTLVIGAWFFLYYLPRRVKSPSSLLLLAGLLLAPYYISEYWSLSRGYFMSGCFAVAGLIEIYYSREDLSIDNSNAIRTYGALATLSSFVMLPFSIVSGAMSVLTLTNGNMQMHRTNSPTRVLSWSFWLGSIITSAVAIYTFKHSGEALSSSPSFSLFSPIHDVANTIVTGSAIGAYLFALSFLFSAVIILLSRKISSIAVLGTVMISLVIVWIGGSLGTGFPVARSWIPYWFPICFVVVQIVPTTPKISKSAWEIIACIVAAISLCNTIYWYTPEYSYSWRSNHYQVKSLFYYSSLGKDFCLEERDKGDKVLIFYWDNPKSAIRQPATCPQGKQSPYGFTNFEMPGKVFRLPDKVWGSYIDTHGSSK